MISIDRNILFLAEEVASRYSVPIPLQQVLKDELLEIICDDYGSTTFDGLTWFEPETDEFFIHLNINPYKKNSLCSPKGRFTLAHELGHYFIPKHRFGLISGELKPHGSMNYLTNQLAWQMEREADAFASALLMPTISVKNLINGKPFCFQLIEDIASFFQVSKSAAALRFADIGDYPIMVVYAVDGKIRWVSRSDSFPFLRLRYGNSNGDKVPEYSVMGSYFYDKDDSDCKSAETVYAQDCFDTHFEDENRVEFYEWCIGYQNRALSVFWEK